MRNVYGGGPRAWRALAQRLRRAGVVYKFASMSPPNREGLGRWLRRHQISVRVGGFPHDPTEVMMRSRELTSRNLNAGLCVSCNEPRFEGHRQCFAHYVQFLGLQGTFRERQGAQATRRCGICKQTGHYRQTHHVWERARAEGLL